MITIYRILCHFFKEVISHFYYLNMAEDGDLNVRTSQGNFFMVPFFHKVVGHLGDKKTVCGIWA